MAQQVIHSIRRGRAPAHLEVLRLRWRLAWLRFAADRTWVDLCAIRRPFAALSVFARVRGLSPLRSGPLAGRHSPCLGRWPATSRTFVCFCPPWLRMTHATLWHTHCTEQVYAARLV